MIKPMLWNMMGWILWPTVVIATADADRLSAQRWQEIGYGLSLQPPKGAQVIENPPGDALVSFVDADQTVMTLIVKETDRALSIPDLLGGAARQFTLLYPSSVQVRDDAPRAQVAGREAGTLFIAVDDPQQDWVMGQLFVLLDDFTYADLRMEASAVAYEDARRTFDAVADSIRIMDEQELFRARQKQLLAAAQWWATLDPARLSEAVPPEQWLRILDGEEDIGYMRIRRSRAEVFNQPGTRLTVQSRSRSGSHTVVVEDEFYEADDGSSEVWSHRLSRSLTGAGPNTQPEVLTETGLRNGRDLEVTIQTPSRLEPPRQWRLSEDPDFPYLSQVDKLLIGPLLPREALDLAFYSYNPIKQKLSLMVVRTEPILQGPQRGGKRVSVRPAPSLGEQRMTYDADGRLVEWRINETRRLVPATAEQLKRIWNVQD